MYSTVLILTESSTVEGRKRKRKEISCYPLAEVKFTILTLDVVFRSQHVIRNQNSLDPEGSWIYVK